MEAINTKPPTALPFRPETLKVTFVATYEANSPDHYEILKAHWESMERQLTDNAIKGGVTASYEHVK